mgnify:CR=1 FL=1
MEHPRLRFLCSFRFVFFCVLERKGEEKRKEKKYIDRLFLLQKKETVIQTNENNRLVLFTSEFSLSW